MFKLTQSQGKSLEEFIAKASRENLEFELRLGNFNENHFSPGLSPSDWFRIKNAAYKWASSVSITHSLEVLFDNHKTIQTNQQITHQLKKRLATLDIPEYEMRFGLAQETLLPKQPSSNPKLVRIKTRESLLVEKCFQFDFTQVRQVSIKTTTEKAIAEAKQKLDSQATYEFEIELVHPFVPDVIKKLLNLADIVCKLRQDNFWIIRKSQTLQVQRDLPKVQTNKPITLNRNNLAKFNTLRYSVTDKADGDRAQLFIDSNKRVWIVKNTTVLKTGLTSKTYDSILLDGELVKVINGQGARKFLVFDILNVKDNLKERLAFAEKVVTDIQTDNAPANLQITPQMKTFYFDNLLNNAKTILSSSTDYTIDGLIFTPTNDTLPTYKWKVPSETTIDFYILKTTNENWELHVNCTEQKQQGLAFGKPIKRFTPKGFGSVFKVTVNPKCSTNYGEPFLNGTVVECRFNPETNSFEPIRNRWDKVAKQQPGNFERYAFDAWEQIINPLTLEEVCQKNPFVTRKESEVIGMRTFHNWVKENQLKATNAKTLLDLAVGRGGDLQKWKRLGIQTVIGFDINPEYIAEAKQRRKTVREISAEFFEADLGVKNIKTLLQTTFDVVSCQFAFHYFFKTHETLTTFLQNVSQNLKEGGTFIGTAFDGKRIHQLQKTKCDTFKITKRYPNKPFDELDLCGNAIDVFLCGDTVMSQSTTEYLINFEKLAVIARRFNLKLVSVTPFEDLYREFNKELAPDEKIFSFLNSAFVFKKTNQPTLTEPDITLNELIQAAEDIKKSIEDEPSEDERSEDESESESESEDEKPNLPHGNDLKLQQLKDIARKNKVVGFSKLNKAGLIQVLRAKKVVV